MVSAPVNVPKALYPWEGKRFTQPGNVQQHWLDLGPRDGEPVVMVHGNPSWSFYFRSLARALEGTHRVVVPDHVGMGLSDKPDDAQYPYTLQRRVDDLERLMEHAGLDAGPVNLVVHDWGGMIGLAWAMKRPERIKRLVLLNTAAFPLPASKPLPWQLSLARDSMLGTLLVRGFNAFSYGATVTGVTRRPMSPEVSAGYRAPYFDWESRISTLRFVQNIPLQAGEAGWEIVTGTAEKLTAGLADKPVLACWGMKDFVFDHHFLSEWERRVPHAKVHRFPDCGHYVLEDASEEIVPLVQQFLK